MIHLRTSTLSTHFYLEAGGHGGQDPPSSRFVVPISSRSRRRGKRKRRPPARG